MCAERIQRVMMTIVLTIVLFLFSNSYIFYASLLQGFVIAMLVMWAFLDFCPSIWFLNRFGPKCKNSKDST